MEQGNSATPDELQQAINSITNSSAKSGDPSDAVSQVESSILGTAAATPGSDTIATPAPEMEIAPTVEPVSTKAKYGDPDLDKVKSMALSDLRPILEKVDIPAEKKFIIYKDILELTEDKACVEPAYNAARQIKDEKKKGEALIYIVEYIDRLGIQMSIDDDNEE